MAKKKRFKKVHEQMTSDEVPFFSDDEAGLQKWDEDGNRILDADGIPVGWDPETETDFSDVTFVNQSGELFQDVTPPDQAGGEFDLGQAVDQAPWEEDGLESDVEKIINLPQMDRINTRKEWEDFIQFAWDLSTNISQVTQSRKRFWLTRTLKQISQNP